MADVTEKVDPVVTNSAPNIHHEQDHRGEYIVKQDAAGRDSESVKQSVHLKTDKNGVVLIPQPSEDPHDPLNWTWLKKHAVFASLLPGCFLTDWVITWGTTVVSRTSYQITTLTIVCSLNNRHRNGTCRFLTLPTQYLVLYSCKDLVGT